MGVLLLGLTRFDNYFHFVYDGIVHLFAALKDAGLIYQANQDGMQHSRSQWQFNNATPFTLMYARHDILEQQAADQQHQHPEQRLSGTLLELLQMFTHPALRNNSRNVGHGVQAPLLFLSDLQSHGCFYFERLVYGSGAHGLSHQGDLHKSPRLFEVLPQVRDFVLAQIDTGVLSKDDADDVNNKASIIGSGDILIINRKRSESSHLSRAPRTLLNLQQVLRTSDLGGIAKERFKVVDWSDMTLKVRFLFFTNF